MDIVINALCNKARENTVFQSTGCHFYHSLLCCLGYDPYASPVADLLRQYHDLEEGEWVMVSPFIGKLHIMTP